MNWWRAWDIKKGVEIFKALGGALVDGGPVKEESENTSTRSEEHVGRNVKFIGNGGGGSAEKVREKGTNGVCFGYRQDSLADVGVAELKNLKRESFMVGCGGGREGDGG